MRKILFFLGILISFVVLFSSPVIGSMQSQDQQQFIEEEKTLNTVVTVRGGFGIDIWVYGADKDTAISISVSGALSNSFATYLPQDKIHIHTNIFKLLPGSIDVSIYVGDNLFSYRCRGILFFFVYDVNPVNIS